MTGLFGGTFDPPHAGHLALARSALEHFALQRLLVVPTGRTPGKRVASDAEVRVALAEAAFGDLPGAQVSRLDIDRPQPAYSFETVRWARERWGEIIFLVGADRFADFPLWQAPNEVLRHARLGVATRPGFSREQLTDVLTQVEQPDRVEFFEIGAIPISSTDVRERVARGKPIDALVPPAVACLVDELDLYRR